MSEPNEAERVCVVCEDTVEDDEEFCNHCQCCEFCCEGHFEDDPYIPDDQE